MYKNAKLSFKEKMSSCNIKVYGTLCLINKCNGINYNLGYENAVIPLHFHGKENKCKYNYHIFIVIAQTLPLFLIKRLWSNIQYIRSSKSNFYFYEYKPHLFLCNKVHSLVDYSYCVINSRPKKYYNLIPN